MFRPDYSGGRDGEDLYCRRERLRRIGLRGRPGRSRKRRHRAGCRGGSCCGAQPGRAADLRAGPGRAAFAQPRRRPPPVHDRLHGGRPGRRLRLPLRRDPVAVERRCRYAPGAAGGGRDRQAPAAGIPGDRRQQEHDAARLGRAGDPTGGGARPGWGGVRRRRQPRVPARGQRRPRHLPPGPDRARCHRPQRRRGGGGAVRPARRADADHRPAHGRDDQVRLQRLPGDQDLVHQRGRARVRAARRRRDGRGRRDGPRSAHRSRASSTLVSASAAPASRRTSRR